MCAAEVTPVVHCTMGSIEIDSAKIIISVCYAQAHTTILSLFADTFFGGSMYAAEVTPVVHYTMNDITTDTTKISSLLASCSDTTICYCSRTPSLGAPCARRKSLMPCTTQWAALHYTMGGIKIDSTTSSPCAMLKADTKIICLCSQIPSSGAPCTRRKSHLLCTTPWAASRLTAADARCLLVGAVCCTACTLLGKRVQGESFVFIIC